MPTYVFQCNNCKNEFEEQLRIIDMDFPLTDACPFCGKKGKIVRHCIGGKVGDPVILGVMKPDKNVTERLKQIKRTHKNSRMNVRG